MEPPRKPPQARKINHVWQPGGRFCQPFTEPAAIPSAIFRLKKMNMINAGMVTTKMFANSRLYWVVNWLLKLNRVS